MLLDGDVVPKSKHGLTVGVMLRPVVGDHLPTSTAPAVHPGVSPRYHHL